jgi:hypothetical protein
MQVIVNLNINPFTVGFILKKTAIAKKNTDAYSY